MALVIIEVTYARDLEDDCSQLRKNVAVILHILLIGLRIRISTTVLQSCNASRNGN